MAMAIICTLFALFALRSAHVYQLNMSNIDNSRGAVYFANQYGENGGPGFGDVFTPEEQNQILRNLLPSLENGPLNYYLCAQNNYSGVNVTIINQHTADLAKLSDSIAKGQDISYSLTIDSGDNPVIPVLIGSGSAAARRRMTSSSFRIPSCSRNARGIFCTRRKAASPMKKSGLSATP